MATQACSPVNQMPKTVSYRFNNLNKFDTYMYGINGSISGKPFLPTCLRYQIHSEIAHNHDLGTNEK